MKLFRAALWCEFLKARRSPVPWLAGFGFCLVPLAGGLFMWILKDPERARAMGIISVKAQIAAGVADWPAMLGYLAQGIFGGGGIISAFVTAWVFGREFSDHTAKEVLAVPASREATVLSKFVVIVVWGAVFTSLVFVVGLVVGAAVVLPDWSQALLWQSIRIDAMIACLTLALMSPVALFACIGRGFLPALGWTILTVALAQIAAATGWGDWFPWSVPALLSQAGSPRATPLGPHSYIAVALVSLAGLIATLVWWRGADQTR
jgi:ABC-2 type transport system permease protein